MTLGTPSLARGNPDAWKIGAAGLATAASMVGIAIVAGGTAARPLNGIGAILWLLAGIALATMLPAARRRHWGWAAALAGGLVLGAIVRPGTIVAATLAFALAGALVVIVAGDRVGAWALLVPAIYLPVHLIIGIGRAMLANGGIRTDPPPTAAFLPLIMVLAAGVAGAAAASLIRRGD